MKDILERLKSPVVIIQIISIIGALVVAVMPEFDGVVEKIVTSLAVIINVFAGLNNPTDRENF
jgi:uncharacterized membrane protein YozB (DUF420 family)